MSSGSEIGSVSEGHGIFEFEWIIDDIFSYSTENEHYRSPKFSAAGFKFYLRIYPYGTTEDESVGWICLYLGGKRPWDSEKSVSYTFGVKKVDGMVEKMLAKRAWMLDRKKMEFGYHKFLERSELRRRKSELAPSDALTLTCTLRVDHGFDSGRTDTLSENFKDMFLCKKYCDGTVLVKNEEFQIHKSVLSARSTVFDAMFEADMKEKATGIIHILDCDPKSFKDFLMYLYSGKLDNIPSNAFELYKIADKYQVQDLKIACVGYIMHDLWGGNMYDAILLAHKFNEGGLQVKIQEFFNDNFREIVPSAEWESFMKENFDAGYELLKEFAFRLNYSWNY